ncbi:FAD-binding oxidoreductase [Acidiphilium sp. AL]|uniref:NAD(P)/FAD-dependent oxidoreductase n=1 Tax=Acidiphilium sp. AL TaxID=2871704 RepID=UPI0021CB574A|nr:FAD-binding oxidoreductase [Acidiphilium sp. AL]MCU4161772.1 FAD-binding oxidoreductase [Acidiphilium sp. AL]
MGVKQPDRTVLIVGGGIIGLCCALRLQQAGYATTIVDPGDFNLSASRGNAGHIAIEQIEPLASRAAIRSTVGRFALGRGSLSLPLRDIGEWAPFAWKLIRAANPSQFEAGKVILRCLLAKAISGWRRLALDIAAPDLLLERGHVIVWQDARRAARDIAAWQRTDTGTARSHPARPAERAVMAKALGVELAAALIFENTGQVADLDRLFRMLGAAWRAGGGRMIKVTVRRMTIAEGLAKLTLDDGREIVPETILLTAGVASGRLLGDLGRPVPLIAERGYHIQSEHHDWPADMPPVVFQERSIIITRFEAGLRVAGFVEFGRPDSPPDARKWARLQRHATELSLPLHAPLTRWMGARPTLPDYIPAIGRASFARNLVYAFGHQHLGVTLAPVTADIVCHIVDGSADPQSIASLSLERFAATKT